MSETDNKFSNSINLSTILTDHTLANLNDLSRTINDGGETSVCNSTAMKHTGQQPSSLNQIDSAKVDSQLLGCLNQEFTELGFHPILNKYTSELNCSQLIKNAAEVLQRLRRTTGQIEKVQDQ